MDINRIFLERLFALVGAVSVSAMLHSNHPHRMGVLVDTVNDAIGTAVS